MRTDWIHGAKCYTEDPELFFVPHDNLDRPRYEKKAKEICGHCPVKEPCLAWAIKNGERSGVWGGLSEKERRRMRRASVVNPKEKAAV
jgi:WhiB family redox-sensing transcriptional regulator